MQAMLETQDFLASLPTQSGLHAAGTRLVWNWSLVRKMLFLAGLRPFSIFSSITRKTGTSVK